MKIQLFLILVSLQVSAHGFAQKVTLNEKNVSVTAILEKITHQTGVYFWYDNSLVSNKNVSVSCKNLPLEKALEEMCNNQNFIYEKINEKVYTFKKKELFNPNVSPIITTENLPPPPVVIRGKVTDENGKALVGASIMVKGTILGTQTNEKGEFELNVKEVKNLELVITYVGREEKKVKVNNANEFLSVMLKTVVKEEEEMVVVAYQKQKKENLTAAVDQISGKALEDRPIKSISEGLKGMVAGLNAWAPSGAPEASLTLNIRGFTGMTSSGSQTAAPLILVDGVERNIDDINPNDVASISVLKDGAASAIYGSRAPYGIILITTKSGKAGDKMRLSYSGNLSLGMPYGVPTMEPSYIQSAWINYALENVSGGSGQPFYSATQIAQMLAWYNNRYDTTNPVFAGIPTQYIPYGVYPLSPTSWSGHQQDFASTNWLDLMIRKTIPEQKHSISISGGNDKTNYYVGLGFNQNNGIFKGAPNYKNAYTALSKIETKVNKWLSLGLTTNYVHTDQQSPSTTTGSPSSTSAFSTDYTGTIFNILARAYTMWPQFNPNGSYYQFNDAVYLTGANGTISIKKNDITLTGRAIVEPVKDLKIEGDITYRNTTNNGTASFLTVYQILPNGSSTTTSRTNTQNGFAEYSDHKNYYTVDIHGSYEKSFKGHHIFGIAGFQCEQNNYSYLQGSATNLFSQSVLSLSTSSANFKTFDQINQWATEGIFGRLSYDYKGKYFFEFNVRRDANSRFLPDTRWATFPSLAFAWNVAKENFWIHKNLISLFKPRFSWSNSGDASSVGSLYPFYPSISASLSTTLILGGAMAQTASMPSLVNPALTWAKPRTYDIGFDMEALKNRLEVNYDWYQRTVRDQFGPANPLPATLGTSVPQANNAVSETRGWEFNIKWHDKAFNVLHKTFSYNIGFRMSDYIGYVVQYNGTNTGSTSVWVRGQQFGVNYVYPTNGIAQNLNDLYKNVAQGSSWYYPGDLMVKDVNGDGQISSGQGTWYSMGDLVKDGYNYPRYRYGISLGLDWNNFNISTELEGIGQWKVFSSNMYVWGATSQWFAPFFKQNLDLGYWTLNTPNAFYPRIDVNTKNEFASDRYMLNLANLRIRNVRIGYNFPQSMIKKIGMSRLYVYSSMENLGFIFYKSWIKFDPELLSSAGGQGYPPQRYMSFGVNVEF